MSSVNDEVGHEDTVRVQMQAEGPMKHKRPDRDDPAVCMLLHRKDLNLVGTDLSGFSRVRRRSRRSNRSGRGAVW